MKTDVLSDVLRAVHLTGAVYFDFELSSPWVLEAPPAQAIAERMMPGAQRVIEYHLIARGSCWGHDRTGTNPAEPRGDLIVFPQGDPHVLSSARWRRCMVSRVSRGRSSGWRDSWAPRVRSSRSDSRTSSASL